MSFLAPFFLLGALAMAAPVVFHLIRRTSREKITFSSLMFLQPSPPRMTRKSRLEHILLLILRCVVLGLLALGFARPFFQHRAAADAATGAGTRIVVLIDASASMRQAGLWADAQARAERTLREAAPEDAVTLAVFDRTLKVLVSFEQWAAAPPAQRPALALQRLKELTPGWQGTHLGPALLNAVDLLEEKPAGGALPEARRIVVVSDFQDGAHLDGLQGFEWPRGLSVEVVALKPRQPTNAGLQLLAAHGDESASAAEAQPRVRVSNAATSQREQFQIGWLGADGKSFTGGVEEIYVPPGQSRVVAAPKAPTNSAVVSLALRGDDEDFDNVAHVVPPQAAEVDVLFLGRDDATDTSRMLFYLNRAFQQTRSHALRVVMRPAREVDASPLIIATDALTEEQAGQLRRALDAGRTALFVMQDAQADVLARLLGVGAVQAAEARAGGYALLAQIDFTHPLFAPFADPRYSDFTKIHFWKHRVVETNGLPGARVLARFDDGSPALMQFAAGRGTLLVLTAGWHPADSQLALSSKFVPLLYSLLDMAGVAQAASGLLLVGDALPAGQTNASPATVRKPDGTTIPMTSDTPFRGTELPGIYVVASLTQTQRFAVNLDPSESRTAPRPLEELERLGVPMKPPAPLAAKADAAKETRLRAAELEQRQKLWRWLLVIALVVLVLETWIAGRLTRPAPASS